ncbi:TetR/AcrR family transcriptional regulator [Nocardia yamanashiensis]|uniref:TetR/AcrR family transcriptional regulator n=1 Tax=Nocardia yamanashiensis TaxID=209247 RepID=UPI00082BCC4F|nr:TetR/AcrR family transcriptional regulator [Nocardia yamanashiensis]
MTAEATVRRGRPRDAARDQAILDATLAVLAETGYGGLTTAAVATRAGVSTATLYRRWSSKEALVVAAASTYGEHAGDAPDTGSLEGDLRTILRAKAVVSTGPSGMLLRALIGEASHNGVLAEAMAAAFLQPVRDRVGEAVRRGVERGEIAAVENADLIGDLVIGPVMSRFFFTTSTPDAFDAADAERIADGLLPLVLRALGATPSA